MIKDNKYIRLVWIIIVLAVLNISTLVTIGYHFYKSNIDKQTTSVSEKQLEVNAEKFTGRYFRDQLDFTSEQMAQFRNFNRPFRQQARTITIDLVAKRKQLLSEMASETCDTIKLNILSEEIGSLHSNLKKITYQYYLNIKNISNTEQKQKLELLFREMFINDIPMSYPGRGGPGGWQHGRNSN